MASGRAEPRRPEAPAGGAAGQGETADAPNATKRRGRLPKGESEAKRADMLAKIHQHPSLKDDVPELARMVDVGESTVRRWLDEEERKYRESNAARPAPAEE